MPNIESAKKRVKQTAKRSERNVARRSAIKTAIKKVLVALDEKQIDQAKVLLKDVEAKLARAASKGVMHKNAASRKISRLAQRVKKTDLAA